MTQTAASPDDDFDLFPLLRTWGEGPPLHLAVAPTPIDDLPSVMGGRSFLAVVRPGVGATVCSDEPLPAEVLASAAAGERRRRGNHVWTLPRPVVLRCILNSMRDVPGGRVLVGGAWAELARGGAR